MERKSHLLFLLPALLFILFYLLYPIGSTVYLSLMGEGEPPQFVGLQNFKRVLTHRRVLNFEGLTSFFEGPPYGALIHNILWVLIHVPITIFLGLTLAHLMRGKKGETLMKAVIFLGMVIPMVVGALIFLFIYDKSGGIVNGVLRFIGLEGTTRNWLAHPETALWGLILGSVWIWTGFSMIVYSAALEGIPRDLIDAAKVDGASGFRIFISIIFPLVRHATVVVAVLTLLWDLRIFDLVYVGTGGGPGAASNVMDVEMYRRAFIYGDFHGAAAVSVILTAIMIAASAYFIIKHIARPT